MRVLVLIPARYSSSRFPGKPLAKIGGVEMIVRVCRQVSLTGYDLAVATDDKRIYDCVVDNGYNAVMTGNNHQSGTDRIAEAYEKLEIAADVVVNVQGDEPFIFPEQIRSVVEIFERKPDTELATLVRRFPRNAGYDMLADPNLVKVVISDRREALYFSRSVIPYVRNVSAENWPGTTQYFTHVGIYAYRPDVLREIVRLKRSSLEIAESLEQLRWLQNGFHINVAETDKKTIGIDTPADLAAAEASL